MSDLHLSNRYFRNLMDMELLDIFTVRAMSGVNASRANREVRRRAASQGYDDAYHWLAVMLQKSKGGVRLRS